MYASRAPWVIAAVLFMQANANADAVDKTKGALAMVALPGKATLPPARKINDWLRRNARGVPLLEKVKTGDGALAASMAGATVGIGLVDAPIPWSQIEGPCETAFWWPEAAREMKAHRAQLLVTVLGGDADPIERNLRLTRLVAAILETSPTIGVYWGAGTLVVQPRLFIAGAKKMSREHLPLDLWIDFRVNEEDDGTRSLFTTGLDALGHKELEVSHSKVSAAKLRQTAWNVAHYVLDNGPVLNDGDTIGETAEEKIGIRHGPSMWDPKKTVIQLVL